MSNSGIDIEMRVCSALITENINELNRLRNTDGYDGISAELKAEAERLITGHTQTRTPWFIRATYWLPATIQIAGQRAVLLFPRLAHRVLRASKVHQQWY
jgi:hypothetical protein